MRYVGTLGRFVKVYIYYTRLELTIVLGLVQYALNGDKKKMKIF